MRVTKRQTLTSLETGLQKRMLQMESRLLEAQWQSALELVDQTEAYTDPVTGEPWIPLGPATSDVNALPFRNEAELNMIRRNARIVALKNPYAKNLLNSISTLTAGKGHKYTAVPKEDYAKDPTAKKTAKRVQRFINKLVKINKWGRRQRQSIVRYHRDGEVFIRLFPQDDGMTLFRFVEPADVYTPQQYTNGKKSNSFGIKNQPGDVESVIGFWVAEEFVDAAYIQHRKANTDFNMKRGLSTLFTIRDHLDRALKLLRNMSITVANQTAISAIRKHKATKGQVQSFAARAATGSRYNPSTGETTNYKKGPVGATIDLVDGKSSYEFPAGGLNAASPVQVLAAELRAIAASLSWPEFMIGSDSSNANYSSTMVAENPAVKSIETEQSDLIEDDLELLWAAVEHAIQTGYLPAESLSMVEIEVEPPTIVSRNQKEQAETDEILNRLKAKSIQTICAAAGLDYKQEQANFTEHDDLQIDANPLDDPTAGDSPATMPVDDLAKTALNGAQIAGLVTILTAAAQGQIPIDSVPAIVAASFPNLTAEQIGDIVTPLQNFKPRPIPAGKGLAVAA